MRSCKNCIISGYCKTFLSVIAFTLYAVSFSNSRKEDVSLSLSLVDKINGAEREYAFKTLSQVQICEIVSTCKNRNKQLSPNCYPLSVSKGPAVCEF